MDWIENVTGGINTLGQEIESINDRLARVEQSVAKLETERTDDPPDEQPAVAEKSQQPSTLEAVKAAARQAVDEPEPAPPANGDRPRSPLEMIEAILSNLTLCIEGETVDEIVRYAKQAQRWALILKREIASQSKNGGRR